MTYRIDDLEVPAESPFRHDALDRQPLVEFLSSLAKRPNGRFVMALDSPWGTGKTTLARMLMAELQGKGFQCTYFNAWKVDYVKRCHAAKLLEMKHHINGGMRMGISLAAATAKIDLAAIVKD